MTGEGRIVPSGSTYKHEFFLRDHQGNPRNIINESGAITQQNHYDPFGMVLGGTGAITASTNRYKFGGKELNASDNIFLADFHARQYDPALTRWLVPDHKEESDCVVILR